MAAASEAGKSSKKYTGGFVDEMRSTAMKLHTKDQSKEGEKETQDSELRNTGLERAENLAKDLEWFKAQGHFVPEPLSCGLDYTLYIEELSKKDQQAFICHLYNMYFGHTAGGRIIGKKVAAKILNGKELEFYKWDGDLSHILKNAREKLNRAAENWTRDDKNHCLEETEIAFKFIGNIICLNRA